ncbi:MAG: bifunctional adenosylcobinamide kinase/adenosylcobinamide-phosphate guanylyltransferase [Rhodospirillales bacterium]|nr:bifunctional adenosylcobinamide kinase/adenosylcobinamide-phosphate guanylyltransferase [Rhodospirillales bacterium]
MNNNTHSVILVLGGARSGKSTYAESLVEEQGRGVYIATAEIFDDEMENRVSLHKERRGEQWTTIEEPLDLPGAIERNAGPDHMLLVDCLTLWLSNLMAAEKNIDEETEFLAETLLQAKGPVVLVSNEVGLGIVPDNKLARKFRDHTGRLNQRIANVATKVVFVAAGLPMIMKDTKDK